MTLTQAIRATAEVTGTRLSEDAANLFLEDMLEFDERDVLKALARCRKELKGRLTVAEIISRIDDGRPGPDEAWAMLPWDEASTAVLTAEMQEAQGSCRALYQHDRIGARLAFKEVYTKLVAEARNEHRQIEWQISLGQDKAGRIAPIKEALQAGRLSPKRAQLFLPAGPSSQLLLEGSKGVPMPEDVRKQIAALVKR